VFLKVNWLTLYDYLRMVRIMWVSGSPEPDSNHGPATASFWRFDRFFRLAPFLPPDMYFHPTFGVQIVSINGPNWKETKMVGSVG